MSVLVFLGRCVWLLALCPQGRRCSERGLEQGRGCLTVGVPGCPAARLAPFGQRGSPSGKLTHSPGPREI